MFHRAGIAYKQVGLIQHPKKKRRGVVNGTFLGADVDGLIGRVSAPATGSDSCAFALPFSLGRAVPLRSFFLALSVLGSVF